MDCASAAYADPATVLCSAESKLVAQNPEQRRVGFGDDLAELAINMERILRHGEKPAQFDAPGGARLAAWCLVWRTGWDEDDLGLEIGFPGCARDSERLSGFPLFQLFHFLFHVLDFDAVFADIETKVGVNAHVLVGNPD